MPVIHKYKDGSGYYIRRYNMHTRRYYTTRLSENEVRELQRREPGKNRVSKYNLNQTMWNRQLGRKSGDTISKGWSVGIVFIAALIYLGAWFVGQEDLLFSIVLIVLLIGFICWIIKI